VVGEEGFEHSVKQEAVGLAVQVGDARVVGAGFAASACTSLAASTDSYAGLRRHLRVLALWPFAEPALSLRKLSSRAKAASMTGCWASSLVTSSREAKIVVAARSYCSAMIASAAGWSVRSAISRKIAWWPVSRACPRDRAA